MKLKPVKCPVCKEYHKGEVCFPVVYISTLEMNRADVKANFETVRDQIPLIANGTQKGIIVLNRDMSNKDFTINLLPVPMFKCENCGVVSEKIQDTPKSKSKGYFAKTSNPEVK